MPARRKSVHQLMAPRRDRLQARANELTLPTSPVGDAPEWLLPDARAEWDLLVLNAEYAPRPERCASWDIDRILRAVRAHGAVGQGRGRDYGLGAPDAQLVTSATRHHASGSVPGKDREWEADRVQMGRYGASSV